MFIFQELKKNNQLIILIKVFNKNHFSLNSDYVITCIAIFQFTDTAL